MGVRLPASGPCHYCGQPGATWDHIVPESLGGPGRRENLVVACAPCNHRKGDDRPTCSCVKCREAVVRWWPVVRSDRWPQASPPTSRLTQRISLPGWTPEPKVPTLVEYHQRHAGPMDTCQPCQIVRDRCLVGERFSTPWGALEAAREYNSGVDWESPLVPAACRACRGWHLIPATGKHRKRRARRMQLRTRQGVRNTRDSA